MYSLLCVFGGIMLSAATPGVVVVNKRGIFFGLPKKRKETADAHAGSLLKMG